MWPLVSNGFATFYFGKAVPDPCIKKYTIYPSMLDQFMVSRSIALKNKLSVKYDQ